MSVTTGSIPALNFLGRLDRKEETLILNAGQQQAVLRRLLNGRDDKLYQTLYGTKRVRDAYTPLRNESGKNTVMAFWN